MRTAMPFDTEKERRPIKIWELSFSWRQTAYFSIALLTFIQLVQYSYNDSFPFALSFVVFFMCAMVFVPAVLLSFVKHPQSGLFLDRHLIYRIRHKKKESGLWRRF
ncbi:hypothetical protein QFZ80_000172 [Paenibacillus sp. V4I7]|nr:hypothetical protein [Paenibacillus sp. V4I7]MDQ0914113.1 hypothetical protein [Paenibacillus sp. V4I5]